MAHLGLSDVEADLGVARLALRWLLGHAAQVRGALRFRAHLELELRQRDCRRR